MPIGIPRSKTTFVALDRNGKRHLRRAAEPYVCAVMVYPAQGVKACIRTEFERAETTAAAVRDRWLRAGFEADIVEVSVL